jgi:geranylgeranyl diphosphate synthase, type I
MELINPYIQDIRKIERTIIQTLKRGTPSALREPIIYQIQTGGKRLRPLLALASCLACGGKKQDVLYGAAALEILHNYSLIIDDIIDHSPKRRGVPTVWKAYGTSIAECISVYYAAAIMEAAAQSKNPNDTTPVISNALKEVSHGEILDILFEQQGRGEEQYVTKNRYTHVTVQDYVRMAGKKSAGLMQASCEIGGIAATAPKQEIQALQAYGWNLGIAFQIVDDVLDMYGKKEFGKPKGQDIKERKLGSILTLYALEELSGAKKKQLLSLLRKKTQLTQKDILRALQLVKSTSAKNQAIRLAQQYTQKAQKHLGFLPQNRHTTALHQLADFIIHRNI